MSTRGSRRGSRNAIIGTRLCPPASTFASSPCCSRIARHPSTLSGAWYSNGAGFTDELRYSLGRAEGDRALRAVADGIGRASDQLRRHQLVADDRVAGVVAV